MDFSWLVTLSEKIGEGVATFVLAILSKLGIETHPPQAKVISLLALLIPLYLVLKIITIPRKIVKYAIVALLIFLIASIVTSFVP